jgi:hypothetical protein
MSRPLPQDPYQRGSALSRSFLPLALITLGVVVLLSNVAGSMIPDRGRGGLIVVGLGAAFLVGRLTTGRYGYAVPAGILIALGAHLVLGSFDTFRGVSSGGLFFVLLGLGFLLIYAAGLRPVAIWPLFPAAILIGLGLVLLGVASLGPLASLSWLAAYWPVALVLLGVWLLLREVLPPQVRRPIATLGGLGLLAYGVLAAAASVANGGNLAQTSVAPAFVSPPFGDTLNLDAPIAAGQTFTVNNDNGSTTIRGGSGPDVHVVATRHSVFGQSPPDVMLTPDASGAMLTSSATSHAQFPFSADAGWVDYTVDVPAGVAVDATSSSGKLELSNISGDVRASSTNGSITGTGLQHVRQAQSSNGRISLEGVFTDKADVTSTNGSINLKLLPGSAVALDVHTTNGRVEPQGLVLDGGVTRRDTLTGTLGNPAADATLHVQASNGSVTIGQ